MRSAAVACGIWQEGRALIAVPVDDDGNAGRARRMKPGDDERWSMLERLDGVEGLRWELVVPETTSRVDSIGHLALMRGIPVWLVPDTIVRDVRFLHRLANAAETAAAVARLLLTPTLRRHLRRIHPPDRRQLPLL